MRHQGLGGSFGFLEFFYRRPGDTEKVPGLFGCRLVTWKKPSTKGMNGCNGRFVQFRRLIGLFSRPSFCQEFKESDRTAADAKNVTIRWFSPAARGETVRCPHAPFPFQERKGRDAASACLKITYAA